jgi:AraC family carnitine catabolism transcriptional activator
VRKLAFLVLPEFSNLGLAAAIEPLFVANWLAQATVFEWQVVSVDGRPVRSSNGRMAQVDGGTSSATQAKSVFVLASFEPQRSAADRTAVRWLQRMARFGAELGGLENGSLILAAAGVLNGLKAAVHWDNALGFRERHPEIQTVPQLFVRSGGRITCAGASAILDLMVAWMGWHGHTALAAEVADHLLLGTPRSATTPQRGAVAGIEPGADSLVAAVRALMQEHIEEPLGCEELAAQLGLSLRQIERRLRAATGLSVLQQYRQLRMTKAHQLLQQTALSVTEVALACGFASPEYFCRLYRHQFGCSPSRDRRQSTDAPVMRQP